MPGAFGRPVTKTFWGDMQLRSGASLHARIFGSYNGDLLDDLLAELGPIEATDMIIVNFGAWYPAFAWQVWPLTRRAGCPVSAKEHETIASLMMKDCRIAVLPLHTAHSNPSSDGAACWENAACTCAHDGTSKFEDLMTHA